MLYTDFLNTDSDLLIWTKRFFKYRILERFQTLSQVSPPENFQLYENVCICIFVCVFKYRICVINNLLSLA